MQLPPSADLLIPVGVGVLMAAVAVIVLVIGLRRRADDAPVPTHDDWTGEHVGEVVVPRTRTVADAVAARQGTTNRFLAVSPDQPAAAGSSASGGSPRHAVQLGARPAPVALAEPVSAGTTGSAPDSAAEAGAADDGPTSHGDGGQDGSSAGGASGELPAQRSDTPAGGPDAASVASRSQPVRPDHPAPTLPTPEAQHPLAAPLRPLVGPGQPVHRPDLDGSGSTPAADGPAEAGQPVHRPAAADGSGSTPVTGGHVGPGQPVHRPDADGSRSTSAADGPADAGQPVHRPAAADGSGPTPVTGGHVGPGQPVHRPDADGSGSTPATDGRGGSAPEGMSADGHQMPGGSPSPAGLSADGHHPVTGGPAAEHAEPSPAAGSSHSVAAAVAHVLAARAAAHAPEADRRGDARDRLLAVLLDDPLRAVGAAVDLQDCQERIDRLAAGLKDERGRLGDVLGRLACSGLRPDQLARLSGLSDVEVAEFLRRGPA